VNNKNHAVGAIGATAAYTDGTTTNLISFSASQFPGSVAVITSNATSINDSDIATGSVTVQNSVTSRQTTYPFIWAASVPGSQPRVIFSSYSYGSANAINTSGSIAGNLIDSSGRGRGFIALAPNYTVVQASAGSAFLANKYGINDSNVAVGFDLFLPGSGFPTGSYPEVATTGGFQVLTGQFSHGGTLRAIKGASATGEWLDGSGQPQASIYNVQTGALTVLGTLTPGGPTGIMAYTINSSGAVAGTGSISGIPGTVGWISQGGAVPSDVNPLTDAAALGLHINGIRSISDSNTMAGTATDANGNTVGVMLTAVPAGTITVQSVSTSLTNPIGGSSSEKVTVTLTGPAPAGGVVVSLSSSNAGVPVPATLTVPTGLTSTAITVKPATVASPTPCTIVASAATAAATTFTVQPPSPAISISPAAVVGGSTQPMTATVSCNVAAPAGGLVIGLNSSSTAVGAPSTVTIPEGAKSVSVPLTTAPVATLTTFTLMATSGINSAQATGKVSSNFFASASVDPTTVQGGVSGSAVLTVTLGVACTSDTVVTLTSSAPDVASVPATITIPAGSLTASATITTSTVTVRQAIRISVTSPNLVSKSVALVVTP